LVMSGCFSTTPAPPGESIPFQVVAKVGPTTAIDVVADTTLDGLRGLLFGLQSGAGCLDSLPPKDQCWSEVAGFPTDLVAIALEVYQGCRAADLTGAYLSGDRLIFEVAIGSNECAPGAGAVAAPHFWLVAVSDKDLPPALVTITVDHAGSRSADRALADLRPPIVAPPPVPVRAAQVRQAVTLAGAHAQSDLSAVTEVAARRFAAGQTSCDATVEGGGAEQPGYVLAFLAVPGEYDYTGGRLIQCP
jgi:hypothetical protein